MTKYEKDELKMLAFDVLVMFIGSFGVIGIMKYRLNVPDAGCWARLKKPSKKLLPCYRYNLVENVSDEMKKIRLQKALGLIDD